MKYNKHTFLNTKMHPLINCIVLYQTACNNKNILTSIIYIPILLLFMYTYNDFTNELLHTISYSVSMCVSSDHCLWHLNLFHKYLQLLL